MYKVIYTGLVQSAGIFYFEELTRNEYNRRYPMFAGLKVYEVGSFLAIL